MQTLEKLGQLKNLTIFQLARTGKMYQSTSKKLIFLTSIATFFAFTTGCNRNQPPGVSDDWDGNPEIGDHAPWLEFEASYQG